jgi:hypothetical protein
MGARRGDDRERAIRLVERLVSAARPCDHSPPRLCRAPLSPRPVPRRTVPLLLRPPRSRRRDRTRQSTVELACRGQPVGDRPDRGVQRRRVRDRDHAARSRHRHPGKRVRRPVESDLPRVAGVSRLRDELPHDRRTLARPSRDLPALALREQRCNADQPTAADGGLVLAVPDQARRRGDPRPERRARSSDLLRHVFARDRAALQRSLGGPWRATASFSGPR